MKIWNCGDEWRGETAFVIAGGPSLRGVDLSVLKGRKVVAVNSSVFAAPFADLLFFGDSRWWWQHRPALRDFKGRVASSSPNVHDDRVLHLKKIKPPPGLSEVPDTVAMQYTSLQGAINIVAHFRAAKIVLLGADAGPSADGRTHHHAPHQWRLRPDCWEQQMSELRLTAKPLSRLGIDVVNCSPVSAIKWWPTQSLEDVLCQPPYV